MFVFGILASVLGLIFVLVAGLILLPRIFVTDEELALLSELPIEESTTHMTGANSHLNLPVAVTDVGKLLTYRERFIEARKEERKKGTIGLYILVMGSGFQVLGVIFTGLAP